MRRIPRGLRLLLLLIVLLIIVKAVTVSLALIELDSAITDLLFLPDSAQVFEGRTRRAFDAAGRTSAELQVFTPVLRLAGQDGCALASMITSAGELSAAGQALNALAAPAFEAYSQSSENRFLIGPVRDQWAALDRQTVLNPLVARQERERCIAASGRLQAWQEAVDGVYFLLETFASIPWEQALADGTSTLIVLNNSDELRATGGFTTAVIIVEIIDGYLNWRLLNSYGVDDPARYEYHPPAPLPQQRYMALSKWTFRDANWSPDHREAAQVALQLYALDQHKAQPQTLVTVNFTALHTLLRDAPPLQVDGETLTADTVLDYIRQAWGFDSSMGSFDPNRKNFLQDVGYKLLFALNHSLNPVDQARLGLALHDMLARRDVMIYSSIPALADWLAAQGWDGALPAPAGDYLMVVDSNLGYNKMSAYTEQTIDYAVDLHAEPQARLTLGYHNTVESNLDCTAYTRSREQVEAEGRGPNYYDRAVNCYWNYIRVLVPARSRIQDYRVWAAPPEWFPYTHVENAAQIDAVEVGLYGGFGTMLIIPPGEIREVSFDYSLPPDVVGQQGTRQHYRLFIQKQPGARTADLRVQITIAESATILAPVPGNGIAIEGNQIVFEHSFEADRLLEVIYE